jgi:hypothetical protein
MIDVLKKAACEAGETLKKYFSKGVSPLYKE